MFRGGHHGGHRGGHHGGGRGHHGPGRPVAVVRVGAPGHHNRPHVPVVAAVRPHVPRGPVVVVGGGRPRGPVIVGVPRRHRGPHGPVVIRRRPARGPVVIVRRGPPPVVMGAAVGTAVVGGVAVAAATRSGPTGVAVAAPVPVPVAVSTAAAFAAFCCKCGAKAEHVGAAFCGSCGNSMSLPQQSTVASAPPAVTTATLQNMPPNPPPVVPAASALQQNSVVQQEKVSQSQPEAVADSQTSAAVVFEMDVTIGEEAVVLQVFEGQMEEDAVQQFCAANLLEYSDFGEMLLSNLRETIATEQEASTSDNNAILDRQ